jgi:hypothetical protein
LSWQPAGIEKRSHCPRSPLVIKQRDDYDDDDDDDDNDNDAKVTGSLREELCLSH